MPDHARTDPESPTTGLFDGRRRLLVGTILTLGGLAAARIALPLFGVAPAVRVALSALLVIAASGLAAAVADWVLDLTTEFLALGDRLVEALWAGPARTGLAPPAATAEVKAAIQVAAPPADPRGAAVAALREALRASEFERAESLLAAFAAEFPDDRELAALGAERARARQAAAEALRGRLDAARGVNDADTVLELRAALADVQPAEALRALDQELARWFLALIQKRLRGGRMSGEVADLAGRIAERFDHTPEGASLRAALPTLRRSAGLCARCAAPYTGIADACPKCLAGAAPDAADDAPGENEGATDDALLERQGDPLDDLFQSPEPLDPL